VRIVLIGRTKFLLNTGELFLKNGIDVGLIITSKNAEHDVVTKNDFEKLAKRFNAEFVYDANINSEKIKKILLQKKFDLGISVNNPLLIKKEIIDLFKFGILNAHPGDLPRYRGNACPNWAIINNEKKIVISVHYMEEELDGGDILLKTKFKINGKTKIKDFYEYAEKEIPEMFFECIKKIKNGKTKGVKQNRKNAMRTFPRNKLDGKIDWNKKVREIDRLIRASGSPFFGAYTYFENSKLIINDAEREFPKFQYYAEPGQVVKRNTDGSVSVACGDGLIILREVIYKNTVYKKPSEVIKTIHTKLGMDVEGEIEKIHDRLNKFLKNKE